MKVDIYTCLTTNSALYATALYYNLTQKASRRLLDQQPINILRFHAITTEPQIDNEDKLEGWRIVERLKISSEVKGGNRHAKALNRIADHIPDDSDMVVVTDCDMIILAEWEERFYEAHRYDNIQVIGTEKHDHSLRMFFMSVWPANLYKEIGFDYSPDGSGWYNLTQSMCDIYKLPLGSKIVKDTGWAISKHIVKSGYRYEKIPIRKDKHSYHGDFLYHIGGSAKSDFYSESIQRVYRKFQKRDHILPEEVFKRLIH